MTTHKSGSCPCTLLVIQRQVDFWSTMGTHLLHTISDQSYIEKLGRLYLIADGTGGPVAASVSYDSPTYSYICRTTS